MTVPESWKSMIKVLADSVSGEGLLWFHRWLSLHCVLTWRGGLASSGGSFNPGQEGSAS